MSSNVTPLKRRSCPFEHLKLMPIFRHISSVFAVKVCPSTARLFLRARPNYSNSSSSILPCFVPYILIHFEMLHPCKACCSREPQIFIYIDTVRSGIPQASAIALVLLAFLSTFLITSVFPLSSCPCFFSSFHSYFPHCVE